MTNPMNMKQRNRLELKLGIKSSLKNVKQVVGLITALWRVNNNNTELIYSDEVGNDIILKPDIKDRLKVYFENELAVSTLNDSDFFDKLDSNPLLKSQIESLKVSLELIWKLCVVQFTDDAKPFSTERSGGKRYNKKILYTKNIDLLDLQVTMEEDEKKKILFNWITNESLSVNSDLENNLVKFFTVLSEEAIYRMRINDKEDDDIIFHQEGIYSQFSIGDEKVNASDYKENMGSLRILHSIIKENLNFFLKKDGNGIALKDAGLHLNLEEYTKRVNNYLDLTNINIQVINESGDGDKDETASKMDDTLPHNWIIFGAPGTGKSFHIETNRKGFHKYERVTFHPSYTYAQFVGTYKPKPIYKEHGASSRYSIIRPSDTDLLTTHGSADYNNIYSIQNEPYVTYEFVPGPLLRVLASAINDFENGIDNNYLLIIEEINRANVASVFGDIFQLLDRNGIGESEYRIDIPEEMKEYLTSKGTSIEQLYFPPNFFIWATMNSADQGVFPMDTAFKRRWTFEYIDIDNGEEEINKYMVQISPFGDINWNIFRKALNKRLSDLDVKEDKMIGPFFISKSDLEKPDRFQKSLKSKLLMYLYEDVFKHGRKSEFFTQEAKFYSNALKLYQQNTNILEFNIIDLMKEIEETDSTVTVDSSEKVKHINSEDAKETSDDRKIAAEEDQATENPDEEQKENLKNDNENVTLDE